MQTSLYFLMSLLNVLIIVLMFIICINYTQVRFIVLPLSPMMSKLTVALTCPPTTIQQLPHIK